MNSGRKLQLVMWILEDISTVVNIRLCCYPGRSRMCPIAELPRSLMTQRLHCRLAAWVECFLSWHCMSPVLCGRHFRTYNLVYVVIIYMYNGWLLRHPQVWKSCKDTLAALALKSYLSKTLTIENWFRKDIHDIMLDPEFWCFFKNTSFRNRVPWSGYITRLYLHRLICA